ncbi:hypothetical protein BS47DRAFT_1363245 [Hydnum rufescens UP504]|uniref:Uncharacterized protein n=1 Tax=Hydnum rufescens UP504 TaxID=1448309 RepID=A0A9P6AWZ5_9AGAM|nr:hypothetical protein BS47DRAFT_1363245 [Hydnum rufescens UP504]
MIPGSSSTLPTIITMDGGDLTYPDNDKPVGLMQGTLCKGPHHLIGWPRYAIVVWNMGKGLSDEYTLLFNIADIKTLKICQNCHMLEVQASAIMCTIDTGLIKQSTFLNSSTALESLVRGLTAWHVLGHLTSMFSVTWMLWNWIAISGASIFSKSLASWGSEIEVLQYQLFYRANGDSTPAWCPPGAPSHIIHYH